MKYLQYLPDVTNEEVMSGLTLTYPHPSVIYAPNLDLEDKSNEQLGYSFSNHLIYKDSFVKIATVDAYGHGYSALTITANENSFKSSENNGINKCVPHDDLLMKVEIDEDYLKKNNMTLENLSGYTSVFYILVDMVTQDVLFKPQSYYDYLNTNNLTDEDMISKAKNDTDKSFMKECAKLGFIVDGSYTKQVRLYIRGDIPQKIINGENALIMWLFPFDYYYNPETGEFLF